MEPKPILRAELLTKTSMLIGMRVTCVADQASSTEERPAEAANKNHRGQMQSADSEPEGEKEFMWWWSWAQASRNAN